MNFFILADLKKLITILLLFISLFGVTQNYNEEYNKAQEYLNKSMPDFAISKLYSILEKGTLTNSFKDSVILLLAEGYRQKRNFDNGIEVLKELLNKKPNNEFVKAKAYNRIAALYDEWLAFGENRLDSTLKYSNLCLNIASKNNFTDMVASSLNEIGFVYLKQKKYNIARRILIKSYNKFLDLNQYLYATNVALNISNTYVKQKLFNNAIEILDSAANKINKKEYINMFMRVYLQKANIYEKQGKYDSAYKYLSKARIMQKNFFHSRMDDKIYEMSAKYDLAIKEAKLKEIEQNNIQKQNENKFLILLISSMVILFAVLIYIVYLKRKTLIHKQEIAQKEKIILEENIKYKNNELTNAVANSAASNDILLKIKQQLNKKQYSEILNTINNNINTENNWNNFLIKFSENYPQFFYKLAKRHPKLTKTEVKLSALLLMKLSSKEIAYILNIEISSVNKSRQRLRKKLKIDTKISFYDYLSSL